MTENICNTLPIVAFHYYCDDAQTILLFINEINI